MKVNGIIEMFKRSVEWFSVEYRWYIGGGDSKIFKNLLEADPYDGNPVIEKKECILHMKKRMYRRVKEAKKSLTQFWKAKKQLEEVGKSGWKIRKAEEIKGGIVAKKRKRKSDSLVNNDAVKIGRLSLTNKLMIKLSTYYG